MGQPSSFGTPVSFTRRTWYSRASTCVKAEFRPGLKVGAQSGLCHWLSLMESSESGHGLALCSDMLYGYGNG